LTIYDEQAINNDLNTILNVKRGHPLNFTIKKYQQKLTGDEF